MKIFLFWISIFFFKILSAQNTIGLPDIINYSKQDYKAGAQNRQIRQDKNGILYFANSEGLLTFNGINWKIYPLPNKSIVRSIEFGPDNKLYVGGQDEFGYFSPSANGTLVYHSLKQLLPENERSFTDVWEIYFFKDWVFFQTSNKIYQISGNHSTIHSSTHWRFITVCNNRLIAQDFTKGLLSFQNGIWSPFLKKSELPTDYFATSLTPIGQDSSILTTVKNGVYLLKGDEITKMRSSFLDHIADTHISASIMVNKEHIALTSNLDGCYIIDKKGTLIQKFSRKEGLQNNNILNIFLDKEKNIWIGLDNGIDFIAYNNAVKHIYPDYPNEGSGYAANIFNDQLFLGTSNGLYKTALYKENDLSYVKGVFELVNNTQGQVWNLSEVNGKLLMGHHDGAFIIENNFAKPIDNTSGFWTFLPYSNNIPASIIIAGTYQGIKFFNYQNEIFTNKNMLAQFESARFVCIDNNKIWISHPYKGIYRVQLNGNNPETKYYTPKEGVQSPNGNYIFKIRNRIIMTTEGGIFEYNELKDTFEPSAFYDELFANKKIRYLKEDEAGDIWFVFEKFLGVVDMSLEKPHIIYFPELANKFVSGFEFIYPVDKNNIFIGGDKGFYHINYEQYKNIKYSLGVKIISVKAIKDRDSLLFGGYNAEVNDDRTSSQNKKVNLSYAWNSFHFEFASPIYAQQSNIEYSYYLKGFDEGWSGWIKKNDKEYTNLPSGEYTFQVKARNNLGNESAPVNYSFTILPAWYQSKLAYLIYLMLSAVLIYVLYKRQKVKFIKQQIKYEEEQKHLQYLHQLELENNEKAIVKLKNENLETEINHKNKELAAATMHLVQKGELMAKIKDELMRILKTIGNENFVQEFKRVIRMMTDDDKFDQDWEQFSFHFDRVHGDFLMNLKNKFPNLSPTELKLCAYLRMNLSSKEMAQLMNITVRGVEISRYRLRKKLQIPTEINLYNYLIHTSSLK
ncbi:MAG: transcriptional regulator [Bacteroidota bacterium]|nr:transcriptional regulator [Bacteroidota bacterium]